MEITIVSDVIGKENNGTTIACMNLVRYLRAQGDHVRILCADQDKKGLPDYYVVPNLKLGPADLIVKANEVSLAKPDPKIIEQAIAGADAVHIILPFALGNAAMKYCKRNNVPVTTGFHCQAENFTAHLALMNVKWVNHLVYKVFYRNCYRYADGIHYPTQFIRECFENHIHRKTPGYVISNGVNDKYREKEVNDIVLDPRKFNILFIGRLSKEKSHNMLIRAVALSKHKENIQLVFAGSGPKRNQIMKLAHKLKINEPEINFYSRDELVKVINSADLYVHPSEIELEGISALEAITCGLVPIFSNSPRSATRMFAMDERNLFNYLSPKDLANKIDYWFEHPEERKAMSRKYIESTNVYYQDTCMMKMREMILDVIEKKKNEKQSKNLVLQRRN